MRLKKTTCVAHTFRPSRLCFPCWTGAFTLMAVAASAGGLPAQIQQTPRATVATQPVPPDSYQPSPEHFRLFIDRLTDTAAKTGDLTERERAELRKKVEDTCTKLLAQSRQLRMVAAAIASEPAAEQGIWPTRRMWEKAVDVMVDDVAPGYQFDSNQSSLLKDWLRRTAVPRLEAMRGTVEPLVGDMIVEYSRGQVPTTQRVVDLSQRLLPFWHELGATWDEGYKYMLPHLRPDQRTQWRKAYFVFKIGYDMAEAKIRSLSHGNYDPREFYSELPGPHRGPTAIKEMAQKAGISTEPPPEAQRTMIGEIGTSPGRRAPSFVSEIPAPQPSLPVIVSAERTVPLDQWQGYLKDFIIRHRLDEGQKTSATAILKETRDRAFEYRKSREREFVQLEELLRAPETASRADLRVELATLEQPIQELFDEFRSRLDQLLTEEQRQAGTGGR